MLLPEEDNFLKWAGLASVVDVVVGMPQAALSRLQGGFVSLVDGN